MKDIPQRTGNFLKAFESEATGSMHSPAGRLIWSSLYTPKPTVRDGDRLAHQCALLIPADADTKPLEAKIRAVAKDKWQGKLPSGTHLALKKTASNDKLAPYAEEYPFYINVKKNERDKHDALNKAPQVVGPGRKVEEVTEADEYDGRWAKVAFNVVAHEVKGNKSVSFWLNSAQLLWDDDVISVGGSAPSAALEFEAVAMPAASESSPEGAPATATGGDEPTPVQSSDSIFG